MEALRSVDAPVYHYTSATGLIGILTEHALWASESTSLNDLGEIRQGWSFIREYLGKDESEDAAYLLNLVTDIPDSFLEPFVLSASTSADDANQWRLYGDEGRGYAVRLDSSVDLAVVSDNSRPAAPKNGLGLGTLLRDSVTIDGWHYCLYTDSEKAAAIDELVDGFGKARRRLGREKLEEDAYQDYWQMLRDETFNDIASIAALMKGPGFSGEREARIVASPLTRSTFQRFRATSIGVVSYVELGTARNDDGREPRVYRGSMEVSPLPIQSVTLGPLLRNESARTLRELVRSNGYSDVTICESDVPLR